MSFTFSPDIAENVAFQNRISEQMSDFRDIQFLLYITTLIEGNPNAGFEAARGCKSRGEEWQAITKSLSIKFVWAPDPPGSDELLLEILYDGTEVDLVYRGNIVRHPEQEIALSMCFSDSPEEFITRTGELIDTYKEKLERLGDSIEHVFRNNPEWDAIDFFFFSSMTQIGANFGEVIPTSDLARAVVFSQAFLGLADAGFVIMFLRSGSQSALGKKDS